MTRSEDPGLRKLEIKELLSVLEVLKSKDHESSDISFRFGPDAGLA
jgi:hypothetical protein